MHDFTVLVLPSAYASSVAVTRDLLAAATTLSARARVAPPRWRLASLAGGPVPLGGGLTIETVRLPRRSARDTSHWILPGLGATSPEQIASRVAQPDIATLVPRLARHVEAGGRVAASCSAVFVLQAAGLLERRRVTTTWWLAPHLQALSPRTTVTADRMICVDGPITTAGAAFAQADLMLHLIRQHGGAGLATLVARMALLDARQAQAPYVVPEVMAGGSELVTRITARVEASLPRAPSVSKLAREFCMSERTLSRHVRRATGQSTVALIQGIRLQRARTLLESSRMTVERVAESVGYQGSTALRRLIKKVNGLNPSQFRTTV